jgi:hypothetical protein
MTVPESRQMLALIEIRKGKLVIMKRGFSRGRKSIGEILYIVLLQPARGGILTLETCW